SRFLSYPSPAPSYIYTLSLHDALPILRAQTSAASLAATLEVLSRFVASSMQTGGRSPVEGQLTDLVGRVAPEPPAAPQRAARERSEEHTSELQSRGHLVCRLLLEKKKI